MKDKFIVFSFTWCEIRYKKYTVQYTLICYLYVIRYK